MANETPPTVKVHIPNDVVQEILRSNVSGYVAIADRPADPQGRVGDGVVLLALCVINGYPVGPWATWTMKGNSLFSGHYFDVEENAWADFWHRR